MNKEIMMKKQVLEMLKQFLLSEAGSKFAPKAISVEMMGKPKVLEMGDEDEEMPMEHMMDKGEPMEEEMPMDAEMEEAPKKPRKSLKEFMRSMD